MEASGPLHFGAAVLPPSPPPASGGLVEAFGERCYRIDHVEGMTPFLVTLVSDSDLWLFGASNGALTAGRGSPATALFPYVTEDKLYDAAGTAGPVTAIQVERGGRRALWHPFDDADRRVYRVRRRFYKSLAGTLLALEEDNLELGLRFRSVWQASARYGFVRTSTLENLEDTPAAVSVLDGLMNLLPADTDEQLQLEASVLIDAYKQAERLNDTSLAVFTLASLPVDRPEPKEALRATTVWSAGLPGARIHLDPRARDAFDRDALAPPAHRTRGLRGAYLLEARFELPAGAARDWRQVADVAQTQSQVTALLDALGDPEALAEAARADAAAGARRIDGLLAATDGRQATADTAATAHHLSNVLFNDLRGGVYAGDGHIPGPDFAAFVRDANRLVWTRHQAFLESLPALSPRGEHVARVEALDDPHLTRLSEEYLPIWFSRRHGDPSRPWNRFHIRVKDAQGRPVLDYQGNWRDIFQNWEALSRSHPDFVEQIIAKFVNASTPDGHNPYRIGRFGVDWEVPDPSHPWSTIGYWGDHQIIYLQRLLELSLAHHPDRLPARLESRRFTYADVPYVFRSFEEILADPRDTLRFDLERHRRIQARVRTLGSDGRLVQGEDGPLRVTLFEKLLVSALAKLANLVPGAGIWMNTQRPEWNDANNALAGYGISTVTLFHLDRYLETLDGLLGALPHPTTPLSREVATWAEDTREVLAAHEALADQAEVDDGQRGALLRALGTVAADVRAVTVARGLSGPQATPVDRLRELVRLARRHLALAIRLARRPDGLFHAYQVLVPGAEGRVGVAPLDPMLEGQVAALGSRAVGDEAACAMLDALRESPLYRPDLDSYLLYPDRPLPGFLEKNVLPAEALTRAPALARLLAEAPDRIVIRDPAGRLRFAPHLHNAAALQESLRSLAAEGGPTLAPDEVAAIAEVYEAVFDHQSFTGRSGTMFAYEGLGSVYWHMVGKLLLAVQERLLEAIGRGASTALLQRLAAHREAIRVGLGGLTRSPEAWGAFPLDAYSHTPGAGGARQPGMTGLVKESILARLGELGVVVAAGRLGFHPWLLRPAEWLAEPTPFEVRHLDGREEVLDLPADALGFTMCQVPVIYRRDPDPRIRITHADGSRRELSGNTLDAGTSAEVFARSGRVARIEVWTVEGLPSG